VCITEVLPFFKDYKYSKYYETKPQNMVPLKPLLENNHRKNHKNNQCYCFLYRFQLNKAEGAAILFKSDTICRYLEEVFEKSQTPTDKYNTEQAKVFAPTEVFELKMAIPGESHKSIRDQKKCYCNKPFHVIIILKLVQYRKLRHSG